MAIMGLVAAQVEAVFMARVAAQIPDFREIKVVIISSLVREVSSSNRVIRAIQSS